MIQLNYQQGWDKIEDLNIYCNEALLLIEKSKKILSNSIYLSGGFIINIFKSVVLKKLSYNLNDLNNAIKNINICIREIDQCNELKYFYYNSSDVVIYEQGQINSIVYNDLSKLERYLNSLEEDINKILLFIEKNKA